MKRYLYILRILSVLVIAGLAGSAWANLSPGWHNVKGDPVTPAEAQALRQRATGDATKIMR